MSSTQSVEVPDTPEGRDLKAYLDGKRKLAMAEAAAKAARATKRKAAVAKRAAPKVGVGKATGRIPRPPARVPATIKDDDGGAAAAAAAASAHRAVPTPPWVSPSSAFFKLWDAFDTWEKFCALATDGEHAQAKLLVQNCLRSSGFPRKRVAFFEMNKFREDYGTSEGP
jgi:hypothetical protein